MSIAYTIFAGVVVINVDLTGRLGALATAAEAAPPPDVGTLFTDVYAQVPAHIAEQREALLREQGDLTLVAGEAAALKLPFVRRSDGQAATPAEITADFRAVLAQVLRATQGLGSTQLDRLFPGFAWDQSLDGLMRA